MEEWYLRKFNIRKPKQTFFSNFANYMYCHLDGFKKGVLYEIKAPVYGHHNLHVDDWRDLPMHYIWQLVHNGFVYKTHGQRARKLTNVELVIVMAPQPISYVIPWADLEIELLDKYLEVSEKFWMDCINDILPPPETKNDMRLAYPSVNTNEYPEATNEELINIKTLNDLKNQKRKSIQKSILIPTSFVEQSKTMKVCLETEISLLPTSHPKQAIAFLKPFQ